MFDILFWIAVGLIVGWNLLPQPQWVRNIYLWAEEKVKGWFNN